MTLTNSLVNTQSAPININLSNNDLKKLEILNKTMSANIELMNKRVDFLILKLINLVIFLFQNKNKNKNKNELLTFDSIYRLK
jgi:hypothetical protein